MSDIEIAVELVESPIEIAVELVESPIEIAVEMVGGGGRVDEVVAGSGVSVDGSDPARPVVSATGGGGGAVDSVNGRTGAVVLDAGDVGAEPAGSDVAASRVQIDASAFPPGTPNPLDSQLAWESFSSTLNGQILPAVDRLGTASTQRVMPADPMDELVLVPVSGVPDVPYLVDRSPEAGFTVSTQAANTNGNIRALYCLPGEYRDVEVHVVISRPGRQTISSKLPQIGVALRVDETSAGRWGGWTSTADIVSGYSVFHNRIWNWGVGGLRIDKEPGGAGEVNYDRNDRGAAIRYVASQAGFWILGLAAPTRLGGNVTIAQSGVPGLDGAHTDAVAWTTDFFSYPGPCLVIPGAGDPLSPVPSVGKVAATHDPDGWVATQSLYPLHMAARVIGDTIWWRTWAVGEPDPGWGGPTITAQRTIPSASDANGPMSVPTKGMIGFFVNHMVGATGTITYELVEVREL